MEDLGHFVETAVGEVITCPHQIGETKIAVKLWLTYTLCYILSLAVKFETVGCVLKDVLKDALNFCSFWCWKAVISNHLYLSCKEISGLVSGNTRRVFYTF